MTSIVNQHLQAFVRRSFGQIQEALSESARRLSSGLRINRASDDAAAMGVSQELQKQARSVRMASRNAEDAISVLRAADGGLGEITNVLHRIKQLGVEATNGSLSSLQRRAISDELKQLKREINSIAENTRYNGFQLLTGNFLQAVRGEFITATDYGSLGRVALTTSSFAIGASSISESFKSQIRISGIQATGAEPGSFGISVESSRITLTKTNASETRSQSITLIAEGPESLAEVLLNRSVGGVTRLNFNDLGVAIDVENISVGLDHTPESIANKIASIGPNINSSIQNAGWTPVNTGNLASGDGELRVVLSSTAGEIRLSDTTGLQSVFGYAELGASSYNISTQTHQMAFIGSASEINAALKSLQVNSATGTGVIEATVTNQLVSPDGYVGNIEPAIAAAQEKIAGYMRVNTPQTLFGLFNGGSGSASLAWLEQAQQLKSDILNQGYSVNLTLASAVEMGGALGAFAKMVSAVFQRFF